MAKESDQPIEKQESASGDPVLPHDVTLALEELSKGNPQAAENLLQAVYGQLRELAHSNLAREPGRGAGMTLEATALVHEAYLRIVGSDPGAPAQKFVGRGHFFGAAALAMRRILVERARHRKRFKHGGGRERVELNDDLHVPQSESSDETDLIALDEALTKLEQKDPRKAKIISLRFFGGLSVEETAAAMDLSPATVKNDWAFARAWLHRELSGGER